ncbi:death domain-associated protein 6-like [Battus philenor]|uniref:death domain-associated protein 6-like n=1 Tax=Battus philenor TaxID=42288 RepID=UPI0035D11ED1
MSNGKIDKCSSVDTILIDDEDKILNDLTYKDNKLFSDFVDKCLSLTDSDGMIRILNKILLPAFKELDQTYKESKSFKKVLSKSINVLETDPIHKFAHIKDLYQTFKLHRKRKKVDLVTIESDLKENSADFNIKRKTDQVPSNSKKANVGASGLHCDQLPTVNLDTYEYDVLLIDETSSNIAFENNGTDTTSIASEKVTIDSIENTISDKCNIVHPNLVTNIVNDSNENIQNKDVEKIDQATLLVPKSFKVYSEENKEIDHVKVSIIENKIAECRKKIAMLEEQEVDDDTMSSPYILCEKYKAMLVGLYKEWCDLTGSDSVKRSKVRLNVQDGHPPGPVQRLEIFLNNNIGSNGHPPFPDFHDVIKCVINSNQEDGLGWNKTQILNEATALFTQCGRALQSRRQKREWRLLMSRMKKEECVNDPADNNPELEARLLANRQRAIKKEADILDRFTMMQNTPKVNRETLESNGSSSGDSSESEEDLIELHGQNKNENCNSNNDPENCNEVKVKKEVAEDVVKLLEDLGETAAKYIGDPSLVIEISSDSSSDEEL